MGWRLAPCLGAAAVGGDRAGGSAVRLAPRAWEGGRASVGAVNRRPRIRILDSAPAAASPHEAAAVVAALECFMRDTALPRAPVPAAPTAWTRAARAEGTDHAPEGAERWAGRRGSA